MSFESKRKLKAPAASFDARFGAGTVVRSRNGRTRGKLFVVTKVETDTKGKRYAWICNGDSHLASNPKRKSTRHIEPVGTIGGEMGSQTDKSISQQLKQFR